PEDVRAARDAPIPGGAAAEDAGDARAAAARREGRRQHRVRLVRIVRGRLPGLRDHDRRRRDRPPDRARAEGLRDRHAALHPVRLLRGGLPEGRDLHVGRARARGLLAEGARVRPREAQAAEVEARPADAVRRPDQHAVEDLLYYLMAACAVAGALGVVLSRNPIASVLSLLVSFFALATIYLLAGFQLLAAAQILVYAGAIMVLFLFVIMLLNLGFAGPLPKVDKEMFVRRRSAIAIAVTVAIFATSALAISAIPEPKTAAEIPEHGL